MKYYSLNPQSLDGQDYIPKVAGDKLTFSERKRLSEVSRLNSADNTVFDYLRCYGFGDEDNLEDISLWEKRKYDIYGFTMTETNRLFISEGCKTLLEKYKISNHRFYLAKLMFKFVKYDYYIFQPYRSYNLNIVENNEYIVHKYDDEKEIIGNYEGIPIVETNCEYIYEEQRKKGTYLKLKKLFLREYVDIFSNVFPFQGGVIYINEKVKEDMESNQITGVEYKQIDFEIEFRNTTIL
jgi:hypothetical protein